MTDTQEPSNACELTRRTTYHLGYLYGEPMHEQNPRRTHGSWMLDLASIDSMYASLCHLRCSDEAAGSASIAFMIFLSRLLDGP